MSYTSGPWEVGNGTENSLLTDVFIGNNIIDAKNEVDARLIAAAPELLVALVNMLDIIPILRQHGINVLAIQQVVDARELAYNAIKKVQGM